MSLIASMLQEMRVNTRVDKYVNRPSRYGALSAFYTQNNRPDSILTQEIKDAARTSMGRTVSTFVFDQEDVSIGNTRTVTIGDSENTTTKITFDFTTYAWGFTLTPALYMNNEMQMQRDFEVKMRKYLNKFAATLDSACIASLEAAKTTVINNSLEFNFTGNTLSATADQKERVLGALSPAMQSNDFYEPLDIVADLGVMYEVQQLAKSGLYNAENKQLEYLDKTFHFSNRVVNGTGQQATGFAINGASLGMLFRFEREAILGTVSRTGHEWGISNLPEIGIPVSTYYYEGVGSEVALAGAASADMDRVRKQHFGFSVDVCNVTAHITDPSTQASPIIKFQIATGN